MARDRASRPEAKPLRLFVAVDVPDDVKAALDKTVEPYRSTVPEARWTKPSSWHVTLKFLGATWPRLVTDVEAAVAAAASAAQPVVSRISAVGAFTSARRARVIWAGLEDPERRLAAIARDLDERLEPHFKPEKRDLTPHLTLARLRVPANLERSASALFELDLESHPFDITELVLYRSHLSPKGATYEPVHRAAFGNPTRGA